MCVDKIFQSDLQFLESTSQIVALILYFSCFEADLLGFLFEILKSLFG